MLKNRYHLGLMTVLFVAGCGSEPAPPPRPVNPAYEGGPAKEQTLDVPWATFTDRTQAAIQAVGWKPLSSDIGANEAVIEAAPDKGDGAQVKFEKKGDNSVHLAVQGKPATPKESVEKLFDKIAEKAK